MGTFFMGHHARKKVLLPYPPIGGHVSEKYRDATPPGEPSSEVKRVCLPFVSVLGKPFKLVFLKYQQCQRVIRTLQFSNFRKMPITFD